MLAAVVLATSLSVAAQPPSKRIGWWWDAPATATDPAVDALLGFVRDHPTIVSSIMMRCGPTTRNGTVGVPNVPLLPSCVRAIPALAELGIGAELWLGETDSSAAALRLFATAPATTKALVALSRQQPGITGFNFDLEVGGSSWCPVGRSCSASYAAFLTEVKAGLAAAGCPHAGCPRVTVDASCSVGAGRGGVISDCAELGRGADVFMNMRTYNAASYVSWLEQLAPALAPGVPRASLGAGLGCWVEHASTAASARSQGPGAAGRRRLQPVPAWSLTAQSAKDRVCVLMNHSVREIDMFRLAPHESPPFPEPFWIPALEKYMAEDSGCSMPVPPPPPPSGPAVGCPALVRVCPPSMKRGAWGLQGCVSYRVCTQGWMRATSPADRGCVQNGRLLRRRARHSLVTVGDVDTHGASITCRFARRCCTVLEVDLRGCGPRKGLACAKAQCAASSTKVRVWKPEDFNHHPYTCCPKSWGGGGEPQPVEDLAGADHRRGSSFGSAAVAYVARQANRTNTLHPSRDFYPDRVYTPSSKVGDDDDDEEDEDEDDAYFPVI
jgi:hypothetical protein